MKTARINKQNGITLIALVITIIVLLILAGVAISMLSGENGILTRASEAKTQTENKSEEEQVKLAATEAMMSSTDYTVKKDKLKEVLKEKFGTEGTDYEIIDIVDGWEIEVIKTKNHYSVFKDGSASYLEWYYEEDPDNSNRRTIITNGEIKLKVGDYIDYNATKDKDGNSIEEYTETSEEGSPTDTGYYTAIEKTLTEGNGYEGRTLSSETSTNGWKVLGVDEKTGEILIVSADPVNDKDGNTFGLRGIAGYTYGESELNKVCGVFGHGYGASGARSINVDDVNKITGYNPNNTEVYDVAQTGSGTKYGYNEETPHMYEYGNKVTYKWTTTENSIQATSNVITLSTGSSSYYATHGFNWYDGSKWRNSKQNISSPSTITTLTSTIYHYYPQTLTTDSSTETTTGIATNSAEYETLFLNNDGTSSVSYWLASPFVYTGSNNAYFGMRDVRSGSDVNDWGLYNSDGHVNCYSVAVRPVVSLKSDIKLSGSSADGWTIQK